MAAKVTVRGRAPISEIAKSDELASQLEPVADRLFDTLRQDPNEFFRNTLRKKKFVSNGRSGRVSWQVGVEPTIGRRVEAKRGPFARAIAMLGLGR